MKPSSTKIKEVDAIELYQSYYNLSLEDFRKLCINIVKNARAPNQALLRQMPTMNKDQLVKSTSNFFMKGHGYGVV